MPSFTPIQLYEGLLAHFGPRHWWPGESPIEVAVGAVLTQNTAWRNVEKAIVNLKAANCLSLAALERLPEAELAALIRPAGYYNLKAKRLKALLAYFRAEAGSELPGRLATKSTAVLRQDLLATYGIGPETADSILLYALQRESFVIDTYTKRSSARLGLCAPEVDYHALQAFYVAALPVDLALYNDFHAQFVALGHHYCHPRPLCPLCPLAAHCPQSGLSTKP